MNKRAIWRTSALVAMVSLLAACSRAPTPAATSTPAPTKASSTPTTAPLTTANHSDTGASSEPTFETESNSGGSVTVEVKPTKLIPGQPVTFEVAMNTHSVDLGDDMTKIAILRDDGGKEYEPMAWEGPGGGGHHRSGTLKFAALVGKPKYVELVVKGIAQVPERVFKWELP